VAGCGLDSSHSGQSSVREYCERERERWDSIRNKHNILEKDFVPCIWLASQVQCMYNYVMLPSF
jgi:hypothetical protein